MTAATLTLTDFLLARIAEDEELWANAGEAGVVLHIRSNGFSAVTPAAFPVRMRAECEAKRRIVEAWRIYSDAQFPDFEGGYSSAMDDVLAILALPYADHPDYRDEWRP